MGCYDLGDENHENTGYYVAKWLYEHKERKPNIIFLHSSNTVGVRNMQFLLPEAVIDHQPF